jgi:hypothetical protein
MLLCGIVTSDAGLRQTGLARDSKPIRFDLFLFLYKLRSAKTSETVADNGLSG